MFVRTVYGLLKALVDGQCGVNPADASAHPPVSWSLQRQEILSVSTAVTILDLRGHLTPTGGSFAARQEPKTQKGAIAGSFFSALAVASNFDEHGAVLFQAKS